MTSFNLLSKILNSFDLALIIFLLFPFSVEKSKTMSFVDVSPSTLIALKVLSKLFFKANFNKCFEIFKSVKINPSIVPMLGKIIPEPLAIPAILIFFLFMKKEFLLNFGIVSVVIIALAACSQFLAKVILFAFMSFGIVFLIFSMGNLSPITPVEAK